MEPYLRRFRSKRELRPGDNRSVSGWRSPLLGRNKLATSARGGIDALCSGEAVGERVAARVCRAGRVFFGIAEGEAVFG